MIIRLYAVVIWLYDLMILLIKSQLSILSSIFTLFVPSRVKNMKKEVVLVIGAGSGLGREVALQIGLTRATVVCMDPNATDNNNTIKAIRRGGGKAYGYDCNLTEDWEVLNQIEIIGANVGKINMMFLFLSKQSIAELQLLQIETIVNVSPYVFLLNSVLPIMKENRKGHIVFLSSSVGGSKNLADFRFELPSDVFRLAIQEIYERVVKELRILKYDQYIKSTLVHAYEPFIMYSNTTDNKRPGSGWSFAIRGEVAAENIIDGVRKNRAEIFVPRNCFYLSRILKILPPKVAFLLSEFWGPGIEFV